MKLKLSKPKLEMKGFKMDGVLSKAGAIFTAPRVTLLLSVASLIFIFTAVANNDGWIRGSVTRRTEVSRSSQTGCTVMKEAGATSCDVVTVDAVARRDTPRIGLWGPLSVYTTKSRKTMQTEHQYNDQLEQVVPPVTSEPRPSERPMDTSTDTSDISDMTAGEATAMVNVQEWSQCNPQWSHNVRSTRVFLLLSLFVAAGALAAITWAIGFARKPEITRLCVGAWVCLTATTIFLTFVAYLSWAAIPGSAWTYVGMDKSPFPSTQSSISYTLACTQLDSCTDSLYRGTTCSVTSTVSPTGSMWGLVLFSWLLAIINVVHGKVRGVGLADGPGHSKPQHAGASQVKSVTSAAEEAKELSQV